MAAQKTTDVEATAETNHSGGTKKQARREERRMRREARIVFK